MTITAIAVGDTGDGAIKEQGDGRTTAVIDSAKVCRAGLGSSDAGGNEGGGNGAAGETIVVGAMNGRRRGGVAVPSGPCRAMFKGSEQTRKGDA
ncbi:MAG: hypothetical protein ACR2PI_22970 [Hyphomicrobiaceae bacterium]